MRQLKTANYTYQRYERGECILNPASNHNLYRLWFGTHNGTLMSRDEAVSYHDTYEEAENALMHKAHHFAALGGYIWHASIVEPDGTRHKLVEGAPY